MAGSVVFMLNYDSTIFIAGLIHMLRNRMGIKCSLALESNSRLFSVDFYLKISADLHEFTFKMQITESPNGEPKKI